MSKKDHKSGIAHLKSCPAGLEWNDDDKICDYSSSSACKVNHHRRQYLASLLRRLMSESDNE